MSFVKSFLEDAGSKAASVAKKGVQQAKRVGNIDAGDVKDAANTFNPYRDVDAAAAQRAGSRFKNPFVRSLVTYGNILKNTQVNPGTSTYGGIAANVRDVAKKPSLQNIASAGIDVATVAPIAGTVVGKSAAARVAERAFVASAAVQGAASAKAYSEGKISGKEALKQTAMTAAPLAVPFAAKATSVAARGVASNIAERGGVRAAFAEETGAVGKRTLKTAAPAAEESSAAKVAAADAARDTARQAAKAPVNQTATGAGFTVRRHSSGEIQMVHTNEAGGRVSVRASDYLSGKYKLTGATPEVAGQITEAVRLINRKGAKSIFVPSKSGTFSMSEAKSAAPAETKAATVAAAKAAPVKPAPTAAAPKTEAPAPAAAAPAPAPTGGKKSLSVGPTHTESQAAFEAAAAAKKAAKPAPKNPERKPGPVKTRTMAPAEAAAFDNRVATETAVRTGPAETATPSKRTLGGAAPTNVVETAKANLRERVSGGSNPTNETVPTLRSEVREHIAAGSPRGGLKKLADKYGVSKQRAHEISGQEKKRSPADVAASAPKLTDTTAAAPKAKTLTNSTPATTESTPAVPKTSTPGHAPSETPTGTAAKTAETTPGITASPAAKTVAQRALGAVGAAGKQIGKHKFLAAGAVGAAVVTKGRPQDLFKGETLPGASSGGSDNNSQQDISQDESFLKSLPDELQTSVRGLMDVRNKKGTAGLQALVEGLESAKHAADMPSEAELQHPHMSAKYSAEYQKRLKAVSNNPWTPGGETDEQIQNDLLKRVHKQRDTVLQREVAAAYKRINLRTENQKIRAS
jgi:hypothetical protein